MIFKNELKLKNKRLKNQNYNKTKAEGVLYFQYDSYKMQFQILKDALVITATIKLNEQTSLWTFFRDN